jgi:hypothetical protein
MTEAIADVKDVVVDDTTKVDTNVDVGGDKTVVVDKTVDANTDKSDVVVADATKDKADDAVPALPDNWRELAAGENKDQLALLKRYGSLTGVVKALQEAQNTIRSGKIKRDMPDPKDEKAMTEWRKEQGIPESPEGYTLPEPVTKRLVDADKPILSSFTEFAHAKNAPPAFVEMAAEWYIDMSEKAEAAQLEKDAAATEKNDDGLREVWSRDEYKGNLTLARRFMASAGEIGESWSEARLPDGRRLGDITSFVQWASDQGRNAFGDVAFSSGDAETRHNNRRAEIEKIRDTDFARYEEEGLNKELLELIDKDLKRGKR